MMTLIAFAALLLASFVAVGRLATPKHSWAPSAIAADARYGFNATLALGRTLGQIRGERMAHASR